MLDLGGNSPFGINVENLIGNSGINMVEILAKNGLQLAFAFLIISLVVMSAIAGYRYITSEGEDDKIQEALATVKNIFLAIIVGFVAIIILSIIAAIFWPNVSP